MKYNVYPYLDRRSKGKDGRHPVKVAISYNRKADYVNTEAYATSEEWQQLFSDKVPKHLKETKDKILALESKVRTALATMVAYDIKVLRSQVTMQEKPPIRLNAAVSAQKPTDVFYWFDVKIKELQELKEALGTADSYKNSKNFYIKYTGQASIDFSYFTKEALYLIQKKAIGDDGMAAGNVYRHARQLRAIFNMAIQERAIDNSFYPFHKRGYMIPQTTKKKKALGRDNVGVLISYSPDKAEQRLALDFFVFSFFGNGMNMKDVAYLRYSDVYGNTLRFVRKKTEHTTTQQKEIRVSITTEMRSVIERHGNSSQAGYIFPIINDGDTMAQQRLDYRRFHVMVNAQLKALCNQLGFTKPVTHGVSRYTFANALKQQGVSIDYISEAMGHSSTAVTEHYLNSFDDDIVSQHAEKLRQYGSSISE